MVTNQTITPNEITHPWYSLDDVEFCKRLAEKHSITYRSQKSTSPAGRKVEVFYFAPDTYMKAFTLGQYLSPFIEKEWKGFLREGS